jgi:hypothetical protein
MTSRDRMVLIGVSVLAVIGAVWLFAVAPEREQASKLSAKVSAARAELASAESQVASARQSQSKYAAAYASIVSLGKAVPPSQEVPSLIYELDQASNSKKVEFSSIAGGSGSAGGTSSGPSGSSSGSAGAGATAGGFTAMPFTFVFTGSYADLYNLFGQLNRFTMRTASGGLQVNGRLLTIQGMSLAPVASTGASTGKAGEELSGTITATAYVLPAAQGLTAGATPASPTAPAGQSASATGAPSSPTAPAIARVNP